MKQIKQVAEITISYNPTTAQMPCVATAMDAYVELKEFFHADLISLQEQFMVMYLNRANRVLGVYKLSKGGITGTVADVRLILATALKAAACSMILCHNHPSGSLKPSNADVENTKKIKDGAELMDIKVLDHIIINGEGQFLSFVQESYL